MSDKQIVERLCGLVDRGFLFEIVQGPNSPQVVVTAPGQSECRVRSARNLREALTAALDAADAL